MIPELMAIYETERLLSLLTEYEIPVSNIIVNMIAPTSSSCNFCQSRHDMHLKNLTQIRKLYTDDFVLTEVPLNHIEVRGIESLRKFNKYVLK